MRTRLGRASADSTTYGYVGAPTGLCLLSGSHVESYGKVGRADIGHLEAQARIQYKRDYLLWLGPVHEASCKCDAEISPALEPQQLDGPAASLGSPSLFLWLLGNLPPQSRTSLEDLSTS